MAGFVGKPSPKEENNLVFNGQSSLRRDGRCGLRSTRHHAVSGSSDSLSCLSVEPDGFAAYVLPNIFVYFWISPPILPYGSHRNSCRYSRVTFAMPLFVGVNCEERGGEITLPRAPPGNFKRTLPPLILRINYSFFFFFFKYYITTIFI